MNPPTYTPPQRSERVKLPGVVTLPTSSNTTESTRFNPDLPPPTHILVKQVFGYTLMCFFYFFSGLSVFIFSIAAVLRIIRFIEGALRVSASLALCCFFHLTVSRPEHLGGRPEASKMKPVGLAALLGFIELVYKFSEKFDPYLVLFLAAEMIAVTCIFVMYFGDDFGSSFWLIFKPWRYRRTIIRLH